LLQDFKVLFELGAESFACWTFTLLSHFIEKIKIVKFLLKYSKSNVCLFTLFWKIYKRFERNSTKNQSLKNFLLFFQEKLLSNFKNFTRYINLIILYFLNTNLLRISLRKNRAKSLLIFFIFKFNKIKLFIFLLIIVLSN